MGFILSFWCRTFVRYYMTIFVVNGLWRNGGLVVYGALDQSSQEQTQPYFENHNHVHDHNKAHDDGWCDCNAQGPWHPLFKPSQALQTTSSEDASLPLENAIDASEHGQVHALPSDLHAAANAKLRKAKKQNHMIHLHLIPHIYVPVLHPVRHPVTYSVENGYHHPAHAGSQEGHDGRESHPYSFEPDDTPNSASSDHNNEIGAGLAGDHSSEQTMHHDDHSPFVPPEPAQDVSSQEALVNHEDAPSYVNSHSPADTASHESEETNSNALPDVNNYRYPLHHHSYDSDEHHPSSSSAYHHRPPQHAYIPADEHSSSSSYHHQYQVHEDSPHEHYYGDYPSSSNTRTQILPLNSSAISYFKQKAKQKYHDRSRLNKKYMILPLQMKKLRVMRPPPPAQVETWRTNMQQHAESKLIPLKAYFDTKDLFKHPFFDFKSFKPTKYRVSMVQPILGNTMPYSPSGAGKPIPLSAAAGHTNHLKSPILVYPTNALRRKQDRVLRS